MSELNFYVSVRPLKKKYVHFSAKEMSSEEENQEIKTRRCPSFLIDLELSFTKEWN